MDQQAIYEAPLEQYTLLHTFVSKMLKIPLIQPFCSYSFDNHLEFLKARQNLQSMSLLETSKTLLHKCDGEVLVANGFFYLSPLHKIQIGHTYSSNITELQVTREDSLGSSVVSIKDVHVPTLLATLQVSFDNITVKSISK